jgi:hypothetical protein
MYEHVIERERETERERDREIDAAYISRRKWHRSPVFLA